MENVVLTPHVGGSIETMQRVFQFCWQNIQAVLDGREPRNVVSHSVNGSEDNPKNLVHTDE